MADGGFLVAPFRFTGTSGIPTRLMVVGPERVVIKGFGSKVFPKEGTKVVAYVTSMRYREYLVFLDRKTGEPVWNRLILGFRRHAIRDCLVDNGWDIEEVRTNPLDRDDNSSQ